MAIPVLPIVAILARSAVQVLTKPGGVALILGWLVVSKFNFGIFSQEVRKTIGSLWWVVVLVLVTWIVIAALPYIFQKRRDPSGRD